MQVSSYSALLNAPAGTTTFNSGLQVGLFSLGQRTGIVLHAQRAVRISPITIGVSYARYAIIPLANGSPGQP